jgi:hypothetical protein
MEIETVQTNLHIAKNNKSSDGKFPDCDLPSLIATIKQSNEWAKGELKALILSKDSNKQIILTAMHEGTEIESYQSNDAISLRIIEGKLRFHMLKDSVTLGKDQVMTIREHIKYRLTTREETIFLLTISKGSTEAANN